MKAFVIAIPNHEKSQEAADRCMEKHNFNSEYEFLEE